MQESFSDIADLLVKLGVVQSDELDAVPGLRASLLDRDEALRLAAGVRQRLGELLTDADRLIDEQISEALAEQKRTGEKLGDILVRLDYLTLQERDAVLAFQRYQAGDAAASDTLRLGRILVSAGDISERQLSEALERARSANRRIGEELIAEGHLSPERLERALKLQRRLVVTALAAGLCSMNAVHAKQGRATETRAYMSVTANVVESVTVRSVYQARDLIVTSDDVAQGYVEVPGASRFEITNTAPCMFEFRNAGNLIRSFKITLPDGSAQFGAAGGTLLQKSPGTGVKGVDVSYRFDLKPDVKPGTYAWPLSLTVLPM